MFFKRTVFIVRPENITYVNLSDPVTFTVIAKSDPDTPITYSWYRYDEQSDCENKWCTVYHATEKTYITHDNGSSIADDSPNCRGVARISVWSCGSTESRWRTVGRGKVWGLWAVPPPQNFF